MKNDLTLLPCSTPLYSDAFPGAYGERRSALGGALFDAGVKWSAIGDGFNQCCTVFVSFDARSEWQNGILENSRHAKFIIHKEAGQIVLGCLSGTKGLRTTKLKSFEHLVEVLAQWARENAA